MGVGLPAPPAVLLALLSPMSEEARISTGDKGHGRTPGSEVSDSGNLAAFVLMNAEERFDIEAINAIDLPALVEEARGDKRLLREVVRKAEELLPRVRAETEDPVLVGAILRSKTLDWFRQSPLDPAWAEVMPVRWGGIFSESRVPGGRLSRKLSYRLTNLINQCVKASGPAAFLRAGFTGLFRGSSATVASMVPFIKGSKRPRLTQPVAQAYLDDLAANSRDGDQPLPLERLSELARRNGSAEVNMTLVELFTQESVHSLTVLDHRFHPNMNALIVRVVPPRAPDEAATYDLVQVNPHVARESGLGDGALIEEAPGAFWERQDLTKKEWLELFRSFEKRKARLDPPPRENTRDLPSYVVLRELLMTDSVARKAFMAVHWKGRPSGLVLLCRLLSEGTFAPDVETDGDYLEAELDHIDKEHGVRRSKDGQWKLGHGWTVAREVAEGNLRSYRARTKSAE